MTDRIEQAMVFAIGFLGGLPVLFVAVAFLPINPFFTTVLVGVAVSVLCIAVCAWMDR